MPGRAAQEPAPSIKAPKRAETPSEAHRHAVRVQASKQRRPLSAEERTAARSQAGL